MNVRRGFDIEEIVYIRRGIINPKRNFNKAGFDSDIFIDLAMLSRAELELAKARTEEWEKTIFFVSTRVLGEVKGVITGDLHGDSIEANDRINAVIKTFRIKKLKYDRKYNKPGFELLKKYIEEHSKWNLNIGEHINDGRIVMHYRDRGINVVYSREPLVRKLAEMVGLEGRNLISSKYHRKSR